jgi:hypothetical protein
MFQGFKLAGTGSKNDICPIPFLDTFPDESGCLISCRGT